MSTVEALKPPPPHLLDGIPPNKRVVIVDVTWVIAQVKLTASEKLRVRAPACRMVVRSSVGDPLPGRRPRE
jgi:hypothetical protein